MRRHAVLQTLARLDETTPEVLRPVLAPLPSMTEAGARLLDAASDLFYRRGVRAVGVDLIAETAGTTKKTLYDRFGSKDALVALYLLRRAHRWREHPLAPPARGGGPPPPPGGPRGGGRPPPRGSPGGAGFCPPGSPGGGERPGGAGGHPHPP